MLRPMRPHALAPLALVTTVVVTGCSPVEFELPETEPALTADQYRIDYPPSELSVEGPDLCIDGERGGEDCTAPQALRWSIPLGEEHDGEEYILSPTGQGDSWTVINTRHQLFDTSSPHRLSHTEELVYHLEGDFLRVVDTDTGEPLWTADLRGDTRGEARAVHMAGEYLAVGSRRIDDPFRPNGDLDELIFVDRSDGTERVRLPMEERLVGVSDDGLVITRSEADSYLATDAFTGDEAWNVEIDLPGAGDQDTEVRSSAGFDGDAVTVLVDSREGEEGEWELVEVVRLDAGTGEELTAPSSEEVDEEELEALQENASEIRFAGTETEPELDYEDMDDLRHYLRQDTDRDSEHDYPDPFDEGRLVGVGMVTRWPAQGEPYAGVACAPDALRSQDPPADALPNTLVCDNPRLFLVNP